MTFDEKSPLLAGESWKSPTKDYRTSSALDVSESKKDFIESQESRDRRKADNLRLAAIIVSWISVIFSFSSGVAAIVLSEVVVSSETLFGYGLDAVLDSLSSVAVIWRFYGTGASSQAEAKERKACIVIAFFFFVSAASLIYKSAESLLDGNDDEGDSDRLLTDVFSTVCGFIALTLGILKVYLGLKLDSRSLVTDSIITFVGAAMSFLGVVSVEVYRSDDHVWYLDGVFGACCGVFMLGFGIKLLAQMTCLYSKHEAFLESPKEEFIESVH